MHANWAAVGLQGSAAALTRVWLGIKQLHWLLMPLFDDGVHANAHTSAHTLRPAANTDVCVDMHAHNVWWRGRLWLISRHLYAHAVCTHTHRYDPRLWQRLAKNVLCGLSSLGTQENVGRSSRMSAVGEEPHSESWLFTVGTFHRSLHQTKTFTESPGSFVSSLTPRQKRSLIWKHNCNCSYSRFLKSYISVMYLWLST